jgi:site-specific recombinase XerD
MDDAIEKMVQDMQLRGLSEGTQINYISRVKILQRFYGRPAEELGEEEIRDFLQHLITEKKQSASSVNVFNAALKFFYKTTLKTKWDNERIPRMKKTKKLPVVLTIEEVQALFDATKNLKHKCILMTTYGSGLRVSEVTRLKIIDIDSKNMSIFVRQGKGKKDRYTVLSQRNLELLREYWTKYHPSDWLFEGSEKGKHITSGSVQSIIHASATKAGIKKLVTVHTLRHSFATHLLEANVNLFYIKQLLGHTDIKTTAIYLHMVNINAFNLKSPLDGTKE